VSGCAYDELNAETVLFLGDRAWQRAAPSSRRPITRHDETAALKHEIALLQRRLGDDAIEIAALRTENAILRDDKAALTEALRAVRQAMRLPAKTPRKKPKESEREEMRRLRQEVLLRRVNEIREKLKSPTPEWPRSALRREKDPLAKYLWPSTRK
jgi:chromosome segregation ATPase